MRTVKDIAWSRRLGGNLAGQVVLWSAATILAIGAHGGAAWWILRQPPAHAAGNPEPTAIMIDLAPVPMAPAALDDQIAPDEVDAVAAEAPPTSEPAEAADAVETAQLAEPVEVEDVSEIEPEPVEPVELDEIAEVEPEPIEPVEMEEMAQVEPEVIEPEPVDPLAEMVTSALAEATVPIPMARPDPPPPPPVQRQQPRPRQQQAAPSQQATRAQVQAQQAPRAAAPQTSSGASSVSPATWQSQLMAHLERRKQYPGEARRQRQQGTARVRFTIDANGNVQSVSLAGSSGYPALDQEVVAMVRRASPVPSPPPGVGRTIVVPIRFSLR